MYLNWVAIVPMLLESGRYRPGCVTSDPVYLEGPQRTHDMIIMQLSRQNDVATPFWSKNDVINVKPPIWRTLVGNKIVDHSDVVGASPIGAAPTTSSFSTLHLSSRDSAKTATRQFENLLSVEIWCVLYERLDGITSLLRWDGACHECHIRLHIDG